MFVGQGIITDRMACVIFTCLLKKCHRKHEYFSYDEHVRELLNIFLLENMAKVFLLTVKPNKY